MRRIVKGAGPQRTLTALQTTPGADWSTVTAEQKQDMRASCHEEQGGLCAYCMGRIRKDAGPEDHSLTRIEHFVPRSKAPDKVFEWSNLLGVCSGGEGQGARSVTHCDVHRGNRDLALNPASPGLDVTPLFAYTHSGEILPARNLLAARAKQVENAIEVLNLGADRLRNNRRAVVDTLRRHLKRDATPTNVREMLRKANDRGTDGQLVPYCQVAIYYLSRKLRQHGSGRPNSA